ncbi:MAG: twin-arginine translocation signal domain-containing protein [Verrucomicrobiales bacterium]|nr:twin-arginine translocation signal domain-containing protein [Verrucomicrobiales bacterium]
MATGLDRRQFLTQSALAWVAGAVALEGGSSAVAADAAGGVMMVTGHFQPAEASARRRRLP